ncbi:class I SAM-dependent methyltransferase [Streptomyces sp. HNM0574]|uniref:class I SAM-dependent methyltransferase n=1 Tax=Streptomyces sp. HNM0574 TaxID=2714954 RepID=UPI00146E9503|nr:class I SAM-dependent methyltransferase [Streptomyces sp. HNM0574]NLU69235.1 methyltransferase domain-containing protein [Streptomyces sp. HNM0574]
MTARPTSRNTPPRAGGPEPHDSLRRLYEDPATPVASGPDRARRQAALLASALHRDPAPSASPHQSPGHHPPAPRTVLDIGCGDGTAAAVMAETLGPRHRLVGIDWSQDALRRARGHLTAVRGELTAPGLPFADGSADAVVLSEVIEHLVDPDAALDELRRVLRPGGHLLLSTPNLAAWYNRALLLCGTQPVFSEVSLRGIHGRPGSQVVGHLRLYTAAALRSLLPATGFTDVRLAGAPYHDVPRPFRPLDRLACRVPSLSSILLVHARKPSGRTAGTSGAVGAGNR